LRSEPAAQCKSRGAADKLSAREHRPRS
jgi:hypothetical protein